MQARLSSGSVSRFPVPGPQTRGGEIMLLTLPYAMKTTLAFLIFFNLLYLSSGHCGEGRFKCHGSSMCVPQNSNCDSVPDCPDGSDEWNCSDALDSQFWDHLFKKQPSADLDELDDGCALEGFNSSCTCLGHNVVCAHLGLRGTPPGLASDDIHLLDMTGNYFPQLQGELLNSFPPVLTLVLSHSAVKSVARGTFPILCPRRSLYLSNNELTTLPEYMFHEGSHLQTLILSYNHIKDIPDGAFTNLQHLRELDLKHNYLEDINADMLKSLTSLEKLYLSENRLKRLSVSMFPELPSLTMLSLSNNLIALIQPGTFLLLPSLQHLYLSWNELRYLENGAFLNLTKLLGLNLNNNKLQNVDSTAFSCLQRLKTLNLQKNLFKQLSRQTLQNLTSLEYVYFDEFSLCSAALHVRVCEPKGDGISSLQHLLENPVLRASVWVMAVIACVGNVLVLLGRCLVREPNPVHSLYIKTLAFSDFLMGMYLMLIAVADWWFRGRYVRHEYEWRHSAACNFCGFLSTLSSESSVMILTLITWDRLVSVTQPLARRQTSRRLATLLIAALWAVAAIVALIPLSGDDYFGDEFYGNNGVCLPLHIHDRFAKGWEFSAAMFILVNAFALTFICLAYWRMIRVIQSSGLTLRSTLERQDRVVAKRFVIIVATDCMCWIPVILIKLVALTGVPIDEELYAWLAVFVLPINSALNPVLYTLTTKLFKKQIVRLLYSSPPARVDSAVSLTHMASRRFSSRTPNSTRSTALCSHGSWKSAPGTSV